MAKNKTNPTAKSVAAFLDGVNPEEKRDDSAELIKIFSELTGFDPVLWGPSIIGFGSYHYKYESGHEGDSCLAGFSPRKTSIVVYVLNFPKREELLKKLGKCKISNGCVYIKKLEDIDVEVLKKVIALSMKYVLKKYGT